MLTLDRPATIAAATVGVLWTTKVAVITARDGSFDPLESWVFVGGLLGLVAACILLARCVTRRLRGPARVLATVGAALAAFAVSLLLETVGKAVIAGASSGSNLGLEQEGGILTVGLAWLALAVVALTARRGPARAAA